LTLILNITIKLLSAIDVGENFEGIVMLDTIIVVAIIAVAAYFVGRRLFRTFTAKQPSCGCSGCGQSGSCSGSKDGPGGNCGCDPR